MCEVRRGGRRLAWAVCSRRKEFDVEFRRMRDWISSDQELKIRAEQSAYGLGYNAAKRPKTTTQAPSVAPVTSDPPISSHNSWERAKQ